jgi:peptide/nickel transport system permease protein
MTRRWWQDPVLVAAAGVAAFIALPALISVVLAPYGEAVLGQPLADAGAEHWLGTDRAGRDVMSALLMGTRATLLTSVFASLVALLIGVPMGLLASAGGWPPARRWHAVAGFAAPTLLLAVVLTALGSPGIVTVILSVALPGAMVLIRATRQELDRLRQSDFVAAARLAGLSMVAAAQRHIVPKLLPRLIGLGLRLLAAAILLEMTLSYGGLGFTAPTISLGVMLQEAQGLLQLKPLPALAPGLVGLVLALALNVAASRLMEAGRDT